MSGFAFFIKSLQDTIPAARQDSLALQDTISKKDTGHIGPLTTSDTIKGITNFSSSEIENILSRTEQRILKTDSIQRADSLRHKKESRIKPAKKEPFSPDTTHIIFRAETLRPFLQKNFLPHISKKIFPESTPHKLFVQDSGPAKIEKQPVFSTQTSEPIRIEKNPFIPNTPDWFIGVFIISLFLLARIKFFYGKFLAPAFSNLLSFQATRTLFRNRNTLAQRTAFSLNLIFVLNAGLFLVLLSSFLNIPLFLHWIFVRYLIFIGVVLLWMGIKFVLCNLIGSFSRTQPIFKEYFFTFSQFNKNLGMVLLFLNLGIAYLDVSFSNYLIYTGLIFILLFYLIRIFRLFKIFVSKSLSVFYAFLYLCTLEILPVLILYRIIVLMQE